MSSHLPDGTRLAYGTATASYQVEGSTTADGRGPSIWDTFTATPGTIKDASDGSVACASYERLDEDLELLGGLGVAYYRFSVAWPRAVSRRWRRCTTGTCRSRSRTPAAGRSVRPPSGSPTTPRSSTSTSATGSASGRRTTSRGAPPTSGTPP